MFMEIKVIGFDADDTLWENEKYYREAEQKFGEMMATYMKPEETISLLYDMEMSTLDIYGYGIKSFILSMIETASQIMGDKINNEVNNAILDIGKNMLHKPVELLDDVEHILKSLKDKYRIILVTKGDLLDQQRKLDKSGIEHYFHHVEIMSNKHESDYKKLIQHLDIAPNQFLMIGNSLRSDILPVTKVGAQAIYVPSDITWQHESVDAHEMESVNYRRVKKLSEILGFL